MKRCSRCGADLPLDAFPWRNKTQGKRGGVCSNCMNTYIRAHYGRNREYYLAKANKVRQQKIDYVNEVKNVPCVDCGIRYPPWIMDFDHLRDKAFGIGSGVKKSWAKIKAEIEKCEVVCSNCHRERTHHREQTRRSSMDRAQPSEG